jgi:uncharacterized protein YjiS (DUF1127 family)
MAATHVSLPAEWSDAPSGSESSRRPETSSDRLSLLARLWARFRGWQAQHETLRLLHSIDDATLRELGISPPEIEALVYGKDDDRIRRYDSDWWRKQQPEREERIMSYASTHSIVVVPKVAGRGAGPAVGGIGPVQVLWRRFKQAMARRGAPAEHEYERLLESSGGKFTDALEREVERRTLQGSTSGFRPE